MKTVIEKIYEVILSIGKARAASELSRRGLYKEAKDLMLRD